MRITDRDKLNWERFGCSFSPKQNLISVPWQSSLQSAQSAAIVSRLIHTHGSSGPLLTLALEISRTKAFAQYCFFPFDLTIEHHRKYLSTIIEDHTIKICLVTTAGQAIRTHQAAAGRCRNAAGLFTKAIAEISALPTGTYRFDDAVSEFEKSIRLVEQFEYRLRDDELQSTFTTFRDSGKQATRESVLRASKMANEILMVLRQYHGTFGQQIIDKIHISRSTLLFVLDLYAEFASDPERFVQFMTDAIAIHPNQTSNRHLETATMILSSGFTLINDIVRFQQSSETSTDKLEAEFREFLSRIREGRGLSVKALTSLLSSVGLQVGGQPGRTPKDYSTEYAIRASGRPWSAAAKWTLENDPATRQEFGGRSYPSLTSAEKAILLHRTKEGVRGFAQRTGKQFPPRHNGSS